MKFLSIERDTMCINIAVNRIATICRSIEYCIKSGSGGHNLSMEDIVRRMFERDDTATERIEGLESTTCNSESGRTPLCIAAAERLLSERLDKKEGRRNRNTSECSFSITFSRNGRPGNGECDIFKTVPQTVMQKGTIRMISKMRYVLMTLTLLRTPALLRKGGYTRQCQEIGVCNCNAHLLCLLVQENDVRNE